jgi:hypothetical protein
MALFTDGPLNSQADLQKYENAILSVASIEGIDLGGKIALAQGEISNQVLSFLMRRTPLRDGLDVQWTDRRRRDVSDVVVTGPLRQWHAQKALAMIYRDAYNNQLNDRYQGKWTEYEQLAKASSQTYFQIGVGIAAEPISKAAVPILSTTHGPGPAGTFYVAVTWVNQAGQEGSPSDISQITTSGGQQLVIAPVSPPSNAAGWNAYVGLSPETMGLQTSIPMEINASWILALGPQQGVLPGDGQTATWFFVEYRETQRG